MAGLLGPASPTDRKGTNFADTPVGIGGTTQWKLAGLVCCKRASMNPAENAVSPIALQQHCLCYWQLCTDGNVAQ